VRPRDCVTITGPGGKPTSSVVTGVEMSGRLVGRARTGDTVGMLLRGVGSEDVGRNHMLRSA
jgi:translation elongation factor EF-Tu-like GTPase